MKTIDIKYFLDAADRATTQGIIPDYVAKFGLEKFWEQYKDFLINQPYASVEDFVDSLCCEVYDQ